MADCKDNCITLTLLTLCGWNFSPSTSQIQCAKHSPYFPLSISNSWVVYINMPLCHVLKHQADSHFFTFACCSWNALLWNKPVWKLVSNKNHFFRSRIWNLALVGGLAYLCCMQFDWRLDHLFSWCLIHLASKSVLVVGSEPNRTHRWALGSTPLRVSVTFLASSQHRGLVLKARSQTKPDKN